MARENAPRDDRPRPSRDPFLRDWYRAACAYFEARYAYGSTAYHLEAALKVLPNDPVLLFYAGAFHDGLASARIQSMSGADLVTGRRLKIPRPEAEWKKAERLLRKSIESGGPIEARLRLARIAGALGRHDEAAALLEEVEPQLDDPRLRYLCALLRGSEEEALARLEAARRAFERAAAIYPTAQAPLVALADLAWRAGERVAALAALARLEVLPKDLAKREDPWLDYYRSYAFDADAQLAALRRAVVKKSAVGRRAALQGRQATAGLKPRPTISSQAQSREP